MQISPTSSLLQALGTSVAQAGPARVAMPAVAAARAERPEAATPTPTPAPEAPAQASNPAATAAEALADPGPAGRRRLDILV